MKTAEEIRLECLRLATTVPGIQPNNVLDMTKEFERYVRDGLAPSGLAPRTTARQSL